MIFVVLFWIWDENKIFYLNKAEIEEGKMRKWNITAYLNILRRKLNRAFNCLSANYFHLILPLLEIRKWLNFY